MRYSIRLLLVLLAISPPLGALAWRIVPPALAELRLRMSDGMVEMSPPQLADVFAPMTSEIIDIEAEDRSSPTAAVEVE
jgi:hypothetical protein